MTLGGLSARQLGARCYTAVDDDEIRVAMIAAQVIEL
jgi:hypothetical protein